MSSAEPGLNLKPLSFMENMNPLVLFYRPSESNIPRADHAKQESRPRLVVIASWTDARYAHIKKYVAKYRDLYPAAQILLLKSHTKQIVQPSLIGPAMKDAASIIRAAFPETATPSSSSSELLVHIFSNGGSGSMANLYEQFAATAAPDQEKRLPPHVSVFDSSPGVFSVPRAVAFANVSFSPLQRVLAAPLLYFLAALWSGLISLGIMPDSLDDWGKAHNNHAANSAEVRRAYIYSRADTLIDYKSVESHAADARAKGFDVLLEEYDGSAHVSHLRKDEARYWDIVRRVVVGPDPES